MLNLRHLHVFCEVARGRSISAAARAVHLTQPAVTQAVAGVERFFGAALLDRSSSGVSLTTAGTACVERMERALDQLREGIAELNRGAQRGGRAGGSELERFMTTSQLRALVSVVERQSFTLAARSLGVALPTIHRAARAVERAAGVALFERTSFGVRPTSEAEKLARRVSLAFAEIAQARAELDALRGGDTGRTVIGTMPLARSYLVPKALIAFTAEHPGHGVSILEGLYDDLLSALRSGGADFLIGALRRQLPYDDVVQEHLFDDPLAIIMRSGHPLARRRKPAAELLTRYPWIAPRPETPLRAQFDALFAGAGLEAPRSPIECNSLVAARALLLESDRLMLLSAHQIHYELEAGLLKALPHPAGNVVRPIGITVRRGWRPTTVQQRLLEQIRLQARNAAATSLAR
ncbi:MAG TPA: LysR family transcriptional regulator [Steroidobacteraceae bacterium]|nr:LysR family transcriptional regulator [Steroidobacteraceae bacterium]